MTFGLGWGDLFGLQLWLRRGANQRTHAWNHPGVRSGDSAVTSTRQRVPRVPVPVAVDGGFEALLASAASSPAPMAIGGTGSLDQQGMLTALLSQTSDAIFAKDLQGRYLLFNAAAAESLGKSSADVLGRDDTALFSADEAAVLMAQDRQVIETGVPITAEEHLRFTDGSDHWMLTTKAAIRDASGVIVGVSGVARDITDRMLAQIEVRRHEERFRSTLDAMLEGAFILDREWRYQYVNAVAAATGRTTPEALLGRTLLEAFPAVEDSGILARYQACMDQRTVQRFETSYVFPDGATHWFEISAEPVPDGILVLSTDTTDRHRAQEALARTQDLLRGIAESTSDAIYAKDLQGRYLFINAAGAARLGKSPEEIIGRDDTAFFPADQASELIAADRRALDLGDRVRLVEHVTSTDGVPQTFRSVKGPLRDDAGTVVGLHGISRDITEWEHAAAALCDSEARFRAITEQSLAGIIIIDDGRLSYANAAAATMLGYEPRELLGANPLDMVPAGDQAVVSAALQRGSQRLPRSSQFEFRAIHKDGRTLDLLGTAAVVDISDHGVILATILDVSDRVRAEQAVHESDALFSLVSDTLLDPLVILRPVHDPSGDIVDFTYDFASASAERSNGRDEGTMAGQTILEVLPHYRGQDLIQRYARALQSDKAVEDERVQYLDLRDGQLVPCWFDLRVQALPGDRLAATWRDVSEGVRAEEAIRESQRTLLEAQSVGHTGSWTWDAVNDISTWSPEMFRIYGLDPQAGPVNLAAAEHLMTDGSAARARSEMGAAIATGRSREFEIEVVRPDGTRRLALQRCALDLAPDGTRVGMHGTLTDITELRSAQRQVRLLDQAVADAATGFVMANLDGHPIYMNRALKQMMGIDGVQTEGRPDASFFADEGQAQHHLAEILAMGYSQAELRLARSDGSTVDVLSTGSLVRDAGGNPIAVVASQSDLASVRHAESEALHRHLAEQRLNLVMEATWDIVLLFDDTGHILESNAAAAEAYGWSCEELIGKHIRELRAPETLDVLGGQLAAAGVGRGIIFKTTHRRRDGSTFPVEVSSRTVVSEMGRGLVSFIRDITLRKAKEEALHDAQERFRTTLETLSDPLVILRAVRDESGAIVDFAHEYANDSALSATGITREEQIGRRIHGSLPRGEAAGLIAAYARVVETGEPLVLDNFRHAAHLDGEAVEFVFDVRANKLGDSLVATWRDVTARALTQATIKASEEALLEAQRVGQTGSWSWTLGERTATWSQEALRLCGLDPATGSLPWSALESIVAPTSVELVRGHMAQASVTGEWAEIEVELAQPGGDARWVLMRSRPVTAPDGRVVQLHGTLTNITARREAEDEARLLKTAIDNAAFGITIAAPDRTNLYANAAIRRMLGASLAEPTVGRPHSGFAVDPAAYDNYIEQLLLDGQGQAELIVRRLDGTTFPMLSSGTVVRDAAGRPRAIVSSQLDVSEIRAAEAARLDAAERVNRTFSSLDAIVRYRPHAGSPVVISDQAQEMLGYRPEDIAGRAVWRALIHPDDYAEAAARLEARSERTEVDYRVRKADGTYLWVRHRRRRTYTHDGKPDGFVAIITDISAHKAAEATLAASEERYRVVIESMSEGVMIAGGDGRIQACNESAARILGMSQADLLGRAPTDPLWGLVDTEERPVHSEIVRSLTDGKPFHGLVRGVHRPDGSLVWISLNSVPLARPDGQPEAGVVVSFTDVTEQRATARDLDQTLARLRRLIDANVVGVIISEADGLVVEANDYYLGLMGRTRAELDAGQIDWKTATPQEYRDTDARSVRDTLVHGTSQPREKEYLRPDGTRVPILIVHATIPGGQQQLVSFALDLTERRAAEKALVASEHRLRSILETVGVAAVTLDSTGHITFCNSHLLALAGRPVEDVVGRPWLEVFVPADLHADVANVLGMGSAAPRERAEYEIVTTAGERRPIAWSQTVLRDGGGVIQEIAALGVDMTDFRRANEAIRSSEERLRGSLDAMLDPFVIVSATRGPDGAIDAFRINFVNEAFAAMTHTDAMELVGRTVPESMLRLEGRSIVEIGRQVVETGVPFRFDAVPFTSVAPSGAERAGLLSVQAARFGDGFLAAWRDVTATEHDRVERDRLAAAIEQTTDLVVVTDPQGLITFANAAFALAAGQSAEALVERPARPHFRSVLGSATDAALAEAERQGEPVLSEHYEGAGDGSGRHFQVGLTPIKDAHGRITGNVWVSRDVTQLRTAEHDLLLEADIRRSLALTLQRVPQGAPAEVISEHLCAELVTIEGIKLAAIFVLTEDGVRMVAWDGPREYSHLEAHARLTGMIRERASTAPSAVYWTPDDADGPMCLGLAEAGLRALAFGPIVHGDHVDGMLIIGAFASETAATLVGRAPEVGDFSNTPSAMLAGSLHLMREAATTQGHVGTVISDSTYAAVFQPIVDLATGEVVGYEALTRFDSGQRADLLFGRAWDVGLGLDLEVATIQAAVLAARGLPSGRWLDLNVSPRLIMERDRLAAAIEGADRPLVLEVTEHEAISDYGAVRNNVASVSHEVRVAVDDAGAGVANFNHIVELRADFVKLDIAIVRGINANFARQALVQGMRHFSRTTGCRLIGEGIETKEEAATLLGLGVEYGQGYLYGRPAPAEAWAARVSAMRQPKGRQSASRRRLRP